MKRYLVPLAIFVLLLGFLGLGLQLNPREVPSPFIDKPAPQFTLGILGNDTASFSPAQMRGQVWLLNVWASWCVACREEHDLLMTISQQKIVPMIGLDYKDKVADAELWLKERGNPYALSISDSKGQVGIDYGVYGVPETVVIDRNGVIRFKQIGPLTPQIFQDKILPLIRKLNA